MNLDHLSVHRRMELEMADRIQKATGIEIPRNYFRYRGQGFLQIGGMPCYNRDRRLHLTRSERDTIGTLANHQALIPLLREWGVTHVEIRYKHLPNDGYNLNCLTGEILACTTINRK